LFLVAAIGIGITLGALNLFAQSADQPTTSPPSVEKPLTVCPFCGLPLSEEMSKKLEEFRAAREKFLAEREKFLESLRGLGWRAPLRQPPAFGRRFFNAPPAGRPFGGGRGMWRGPGWGGGWCWWWMNPPAGSPPDEKSSK